MTTIFEAMNREVVAEAALLYHENGLNVLPLDGKKPKLGLGHWRRWIQDRQTYATVQSWVFDYDLLNQNVGIVCGKVSGGLVVIDLDGLDAVREFGARFPRLTETLTVATGSRQGRHLYYWCENTETVRMKGFEVRGDGCYVVAPPSVHPGTGAMYMPLVISRTTRPARLEVDAVRDWIRSHRPVGTAPVSAKHEVARAPRWAEAALRGELSLLAKTNRNFNDALYRAALKLGSIVADGVLSRDRVENELYAVAVAAGYVARDGERQTWATIASGIGNGLKNPRSRNR